MQIQLKCKLNAYSKIESLGEVMLHNSLQGRDLAEAHPSSAITYGGASVEIELDALHTNLDSLTNTVLPTKMDKVGGATGKIAIFKADGNIESSGINSTNVATDIDVSEEDGTVSIQLQNVGTGIGTIRQFNKSSIGLSDVVNTGDSDTPTQGGSQKFTTGGAYNLYTGVVSMIDSRVPQHESNPLELVQLDDEGKSYEPSGIVASDIVRKTTTVNGHSLSSDVTVTKGDVGLGSVVNTGDSDTPVENGTTKFTTGGAYTELNKKSDKVLSATNNDIATLDENGNLKDSGINIQSNTSPNTGSKLTSSDNFGLSSSNGDVDIESANGSIGLVSTDGEINTFSHSSTSIVSESEITFRNSMNIPVTLTQIIYGLGLGCIVKGTQITMADGTKKAVEDIKVGDEVLGYDIENDTQVPTVVIFNMPRKPVTLCRLNMFEDGSTLKTVDEHYVFNVNGSYCSDITKWEVCDAVLKQDGTTSNFVGYFLESDSGFENYNILTSNNTYYANEMLNSCWPPSKFHYCDEFHIEMPDELYNSIEQELQYHRHGAYNVDNPEFLEAVAELEKQETEINKNIRKQKAYLAATDYQPIKTTEKIINAILTSSDYAEFKDKTQDIYDTDLAEKIARRAAARQSIVDTEELSASLGRQITALKEQYGVITPFDNLSHREQFKICNRIGNENIDKYRAWEWITSHKSSK